MKHVYRIIKCFLVFVLIKLPMSLSALIVVPIAVLFTLKDKRICSDKILDQRLPKILAWYDNGDDIDRVYGLNGDIERQKRYYSITDEMYGNLSFHVDAAEKAYNSILYRFSISTLDIYKARVKWLLRNPVNYFQYKVLGFRTDASFQVTGYAMDKDIEDAYEVGDYHTGGKFYKEIINSDGKVYYEYYWVYPYYKRFPNKCFRIRIGHKLGINGPNFGRKYTQFTFNFHPWHGYSGAGL